MNLKQQLREKITANELSILRRAFDVVGDIAVVEVPRQLQGKKKVIADAIMQTHPNIKSVWMERGGRTGKLRLQKLQWLAGEKRTETIAVENGIRLKLDVAKVYYSPRMASERKRIYLQISRPETVLVMFSGAAPYVVEIAKHTSAKMIYSIEVNKAAHQYAIENAKLNKVEGKVKLYCGDVKKLLPQLKVKFDRILMPLPKGASEFLGLALASAKKNCIIHYYDFLPEESFNVAADRVEAAAKKMKRKVKIMKVVKCGQLAPRQYRVCVDFKAN